MGDKWSLLVIAMLERMPGQRSRFSTLKRSIPGISYELTGLGKAFMKPVCALVDWLQANWSTIKTARDAFDRRSPSRRKAS